MAEGVQGVEGWVFLGLLALLVLVGLMVFIASLPDIRRYSKVRQM